jgi:hypothetical protein
VTGAAETQQLHRYPAVQGEVGGAPDLARPAYPDTVVQPVAAIKRQSGHYWNSGHTRHNDCDYPL